MADRVSSAAVAAREQGTVVVGVASAADREAVAAPFKASIAVAARRAVPARGAARAEQALAAGVEAAVAVVVAVAAVVVEEGVVEDAAGKK